MSDYDWFGFLAEFEVGSNGNETAILSGPEDPGTYAPWVQLAYDPDIGSVGDADWFIRHIGELSVTPQAAPDVQVDATLAWCLRYVPDLRVIDGTAFGDLTLPATLSDDNVISHGLMQGRMDNGVLGLRDVQVHNANEGLAGNAWDVESVKPSDDVSALMLTVEHSFPVPVTAFAFGRTLTRG